MFDVIILVLVTLLLPVEWKSFSSENVSGRALPEV